MSTQGVTLSKEPQQDWNNKAFRVAQGPLSYEELDFEISLLPSLESDLSIGPIFSELQFLPDLFLPRYPSFNSQLLDQQLILYSIHMFLVGPPDVLIVGSSRAIQGVDPKTLRQSLINQGHGELDIYNFSINGATAQVIELLLREILTPDQLPKLVIWADGSRAFNSGRPDRTYLQIAQSDGFKQLENGMHPILVHPTEAIAQANCQDYLDPQFGYRQSSLIELGEESSFISASNVSMLTQGDADTFGQMKSTFDPYISVATGTCPAPSPSSNFYSETKAILSSPFQNVPSNILETDQYPTTEFVTYSSASSDSSIASLQDLASRLPFELEVNGFLPNSTEFDPSSYYQRFPHVAGEYDANYVPFELHGVQTEATQRLAQSMQNKQIPLVFVNLPLTLDYLDETRLDYEAQFLQHMAQVSQQSRFTFVNLNQVDLAKNQYFADPSHLNEQGARAVAKAIAQQNSISWPR
ncbi:MAG: hypothetical protein AAGD25_07810 [Cyanobacteria bacterium P01_F01_bin.150]